jgi:hypothetical protein
MKTMIERSKCIGARSIMKKEDLQNMIISDENSFYEIDTECMNSKKNKVGVGIELNNQSNNPQKTGEK